jgi:hypothetical protein
MADASEIADIERRLSAALDRIGKGLGRIGAPTAGAAKAPADVAALKEALDTERQANAQLQERLKAVRERDSSALSTLEAKVDRLTQQLDVQGLELMRMRKVTVQLRETVRVLTDAAVSGTTEPHLINKAMLAELEALRALRQTEVAEMDEILAELRPILEDMPHA